MELLAFTSHRSSPRRSLDRVLALALTFLIAQASVMYTWYWAGHTEGLRVSNGILTDLNYTLDGLHIVISLCLCLCVIGLLSRRIWGLILSLLTLVSILVTYTYWHIITVKYLSDLQYNNELYLRVSQETGYFHGSTKWDLVVLAFVAVLSLWHLVRLIEILLKDGALQYVTSTGFASDPSFRLALGAAGLATLIHVVWVVSAVQMESPLAAMHIRLGVALFISAGTLFFRRLVGLLLSAFALAWISLEYLAWYLWSARVKSRAGLESLPASIIEGAGLYSATPWNAVVLVLVIVVLLWEIKRIKELRKNSAIRSGRRETDFLNKQEGWFWNNASALIGHVRRSRGMKIIVLTIVGIGALTLCGF